MFLAHDSVTSSDHSKDTSWKIKTSTNSLPALDILNRNFPDLINNDVTCLLYHSATETNEHIWRCPSLLPYIRNTFRILAKYAEDILKKMRTNWTCASWTRSNIPIPSIGPETTIPLSPRTNALLLLRSYVSENLYRCFRIHFNTHKATSKAILNLWKFLCPLSKRMFGSFVRWHGSNRKINMASRKRVSNYIGKIGLQVLHVIFVTLLTLPIGGLMYVRKRLFWESYLRFVRI